jgi:hypothetical protein
MHGEARRGEAMKTTIVIGMGAASTPRGGMRRGWAWRGGAWRGQARRGAAGHGMAWRGKARQGCFLR